MEAIASADMLLIGGVVYPAGFIERKNTKSKMTEKKEVESGCGMGGQVEQ